MRLLAAAAAVLSLSVLALAGDAKTKHPHFDDKGTLHWFTKVADAQAAAKKQDRLVFIEYGREA
jgi:hypothetical protein